MKEQTVTFFLFVPGSKWLMTTAHVSGVDEMQRCAEEFAKVHGKGKWTELRVYTSQPEWQARRSGVMWNSTGDTKWAEAASPLAPLPEEPR